MDTLRVASVGIVSTMTAKVIVAIFTCLELHLLVQGYVPINPSKYGGRILYGQVADVSNFRFMVKLIFYEGMCGGSIIANEWIMTAAHCTWREPCPSVKIYPAIWEPTRFVNPRECIEHPSYRNGSHKYDIGLLRVRPGFQPEDLTQIIPLPSRGKIFPPGTAAVVAGWGETEGRVYPDRLLWADVKIKEWNYCARLLREMPRRALCTLGTGARPPGICIGDSGGPVIINGVVAGVISFFILDSEKKCELGAPSMHVSVVDYLPWIYSYVEPGRDTTQMLVQPEN